MKIKEYNLRTGEKVAFEYDRYGVGKITLEGMDLLMSMIESRPKGEWIKSDTDGFICSACGSGYRNQPTCMGKPMFEYCPVCGARMKGADDEAD